MMFCDLIVWSTVKSAGNILNECFHSDVIYLLRDCRRHCGAEQKCPVSADITFSDPELISFRYEVSVSYPYPFIGIELYSLVFTINTESGNAMV